MLEVLELLEVLEMLELISVRKYLIWVAFKP